MHTQMFFGITGPAANIAQGETTLYACSSPDGTHFISGGISKRFSLNLLSDAMCVAVNLVKANYFCGLSEAAKLEKARRTLAPRYQVGALDIDGHSATGRDLRARTEATQGEIEGIASDPAWGGFDQRAGAGIALRLACEEGRR